MVSESEFKRILWASRRGMLELDLVLAPYIEQCYRQLPEARRQQVVRLLESQDTELFSYFIGRERPQDAVLAELVDDILAFARTPRS